MLGAFFFPQTDGHHFKETAFDLALKVGVGFNTGHDGNMVSLPGLKVAKDGRVFDFTDVNNLHIGPDGATHVLFCDSVVLQYLPLPLSRGTAVTAHSGNDKWNQAYGLAFVHHGPGYLADISDTPTTGGDGDGLARIDLVSESEIADAVLHFRDYIVKSQALGGLANAQHSRE